MGAQTSCVWCTADMRMLNMERVEEERAQLQAYCARLEQDVVRMEERLRLQQEERGVMECDLREIHQELSQLRECPHSALSSSFANSSGGLETVATTTPLPSVYRQHTATAGDTDGPATGSPPRRVSVTVVGDGGTGHRHSSVSPTRRALSMGSVQYEDVVSPPTEPALSNSEVSPYLNPEDDEDNVFPVTPTEDAEDEVAGGSPFVMPAAALDHDPPRPVPVLHNMASFEDGGGCADEPSCDTARHIASDGSGSGSGSSGLEHHAAADDEERDADADGDAELAAIQARLLTTLTVLESGVQEAKELTLLSPLGPGTMSF